MIRKRLLLLIFITLTAGKNYAQSVTVSFRVDTSDEHIQTAVHLLQSYINCFDKKQKPDYSCYWSTKDCKRTSQPDEMVVAISSDIPTYNFGNIVNVYFAQTTNEVVHLKAMLARTDSSGDITVWAIMNYYVIMEEGHPRFISEISLHKSKYTSYTRGNITYHFPSSHSFNKAVSDHMLQRFKKIEHDWGFQPVNINYYYAPDGIALANMRGFDYVLGMDEQNPSGISLPEQRIIYCQGLGEGYLHEVLHLYFNPLYEQSPMCHALIYYLAGGLGKDFDWMVHRMNEYLGKYPETDLSQYETIRSKDRMLNIGHITNGLLCKMLDEKDGLAGLKRALQYKTCDELLQTEFGITPQTADTFLKAAFKKHDKSAQKNPTSASAPFSGTRQQSR